MQDYISIGAILSRQWKPEDKIRTVETGTTDH